MRRWKMIVRSRSGIFAQRSPYSGVESGSQGWSSCFNFLVPNGTVLAGISSNSEDMMSVTMIVKCQRRVRLWEGLKWDWTPNGIPQARPAFLTTLFIASLALTRLLYTSSPLFKFRVYDVTTSSCKLVDPLTRKALILRLLFCCFLARIDLITWSPSLYLLLPWWTRYGRY